MKVLSVHDLSQIIHLRANAIQKDWLVRVREVIPKSREFSDVTIIDSLDKYLNEFSKALTEHSSVHTSESLATAREHGDTRTRLGYSVRDVSAEYTMLRESMILEAGKDGVVSNEAQTALARLSDAGMINAVEEFLEKTVVEHERFTRRMVEAKANEQVVTLEVLRLQGEALQLSMQDAPLTDVLAVMTRLVEVQASGTLMASVLIADKDEKHLLHGAAPRLPDEYNKIVHGIPIGQDIGSCGTAAFTKKIVIVSDIENDPRWRDYKEIALKYGLRACWSIPILSSTNNLLGTFAFYSKVPQEPTDREIEIVAVAAQTTALIMERRRIGEERAVAALEAERANEAKSSFLANMSHEIRTPLGAIMGFSELARQNGTSQEQVTSYLGIVERNSAQVLRIIDDILDLAKVEAGRVDLEIIEFSLTEFLADFTSLIGFRAREKGIAFQIRAETDLPAMISTDPTRLRQILTNAVGNAIKFTNKGFVTLHVCYRDDKLIFGIEDSGRGISAEQAGNLFQAFVQADISTTRKFGGTGLGLVLTKRLCQLMGGDYKLERSEIDVGSKFNASVNVKLRADANLMKQKEIVFATAEEKATPTARNRLKDVSVLLVEDSPDNQVLVSLLLEREGAKVDIASDGLAGVEKAMAGRYDVVLMDIQMPIMDGHEAVRTLRDKNYAKPVIALTAHAMKEEASRAIRSGFTSFLSKPIQREALISMVSVLADQRRL